MDSSHSSSSLNAVVSGTAVHAARAVAAPEVTFDQTGMAPAEQPRTMVAQPWVGFWRGLFRAAVGRSVSPGAAREDAPDLPAWREAAKRRRSTLLSLIGISTLLASALYVYLSGMAETMRPLQCVGFGLFVVLFAWVSAGFWTACMGFAVLRRGDPHSISLSDLAKLPLSSEGRTAVVMPICNEDVATVFSGLAATCQSLLATGASAHFDVFVLSDTSRPELRDEEVAAWRKLQEAFGADRVFYRWRTDRQERKAGNIAEFCRRWGARYRYMVVLDADSIMSGEALLTLVRAMESKPHAGIIQAPTRTTGALTLHARAQQFAARVVGPVFAAGMRYWQLGDSHYFGHNAILRVEPFMQHCALAPVRGRGALAGGIMSHDFVEAALMRRAGYEVWMLPEIDGSYEQNPPDLSSELQRDRRWCHGNLQNLRLIAEPGLAPAHRAMLATGAMSYLSAPLWMAFVVVGLVDAIGGSDEPIAHGGPMLWLWCCVMTMLMLPRAMGLHALVKRGETRPFGGKLRLGLGVAFESMLSVLQAPLRMFTHTVFVLAPLMGLRLEWTSPPRVATGIPWRAALQHQGMRALLAALALANLATIDADVALWLVPLVMPLALAVPLSVLTSRVSIGVWLRRWGVMGVPEERMVPAVLIEAPDGDAALPMLPAWPSAAGAAH